MMLNDRLHGDNDVVACKRAPKQNKPDNRSDVHRGINFSHFVFHSLSQGITEKGDVKQNTLGHSDKTFAIFILFWFYLNGPRTATGGFCLKLKYKKMRKRVIFFATSHNPPIICFFSDSTLTQYPTCYMYVVVFVLNTHLLYVPLPTSKLFTGTQLPAEIIVSVSLALAS